MAPVPTSGPVWGAAMIGAVINRSTRDAYYLLSKGRIPAKKMGRDWVSTVEVLKAAVGEAPWYVPPKAEQTAPSAS